MTIGPLSIILGAMMLFVLLLVEVIRWCWIPIGLYLLYRLFFRKDQTIT